MKSFDQQIKDRDILWDCPHCGVTDKVHDDMYGVWCDECGNGVANGRDKS